MLYAIVNEERTTATPKATATCPCCDTAVKAKCGKIVSWHWSHVNLKECDSFSEPMTLWHLNWQQQFPREAQEVTMTDANGTRHRADVYLQSQNTVIELQHSSIKPEEVEQREAYYGSIGTLVWVVDVSYKFWYKTEEDRALNRITIRNRPSLANCKHLFLDAGGDELMYIPGGFLNNRYDMTYTYVGFSRQEFVSNPLLCLAVAEERGKQQRKEAYKLMNTYVRDDRGSVVIKWSTEAEEKVSQYDKIYTCSQASATNLIGGLDTIKCFGSKAKLLADAEKYPERFMVDVVTNSRGYKEFDVRRLSFSERKALRQLSA